MSEICFSCKNYIPGNSICMSGFPLPYAGKIPMCLKDDFDDHVISRFFDSRGYPRLIKTRDPENPFPYVEAGK